MHIIIEADFNHRSVYSSIRDLLEIIRSQRLTLILKYNYGQPCSARSSCLNYSPLEREYNM